jgi:hypothetical protein
VGRSVIHQQDTGTMSARQQLNAVPCGLHALDAASTRLRNLRVQVAPAIRHGFGIVTDMDTIAAAVPAHVAHV